MNGGQSSKTFLFGHRHSQALKCLIRENVCHLFSLDAFEAFSYMTALHGLQDHPGIKAIMVIGGLVAEAACDEKLDGLY